MRNFLHIGVLSTFLTLAGCGDTPKSTAIAIIPQPNNMVVGTGTMRANEIQTKIDTTMANAEGYRLIARDGIVEIIGGSDAGLFYGLQTLQQLKDSAGYIPEITIEDAPRFPWRGVMLDVSRHFYPKQDIKQFLDILAYHKINTFHWHLTDGIGWRIEIDKYPLLTLKGAWRKVKNVQAPWVGLELSDESKKGDADTYGGYYTKADIREIVAYAKERHITVIPEIEMPGHSEAATFAYPEFNCEGAKTGSGVYCAGKDETFEFLGDVIDEVIEIFPESPYIHIGGDEVGKGQWAACPMCQKRKQKEGLKDEHELQSYFVQRMEQHINAKGKRMIGWDEILEGGLAPNATVMSWTGFQGGIKAANAGHDVVMCPLDYVYFDHYQGRNIVEPQAWGGLNDVKRVYSFDPLPKDINPEKTDHVKGGQANLWTENIRTVEHLQYMLLPRLAALSETLWSDTLTKDWKRFEAKLGQQYDRYEARGWNFAQSALTPFVSEQYFNADGSLTMRLATELNGYPIRYTLDGSAPTASAELYSDSILITEPTMLSAVTFRNQKPAGSALSVPNLLNKATAAKVTYTTPYADDYSGDGDGTLTDNKYAFKRGDDKAWLGFERTDMDLTLDLGELQTVEGLMFRFLQHMGSTSVMLPLQITVWGSVDGNVFTELADIAVADDSNSDAIIKPYDVQLKTPVDAQYLRIKAVNRGILPKGHLRAGGSAWIFTDEIVVY